jgi:hypothetical protein
MTSTIDTGGTVINYSDRFNLTGLTGTTPAQYRQAAEALNGATAGPDTVGGSGSSSSSSSSTSTATATSSTGASTSASTTTATASGSGSVATTTDTGRNQVTLQATASASAAASSGFSSGAVAGMSVGITLAFIAVVGLVAAWLVMRHRRKPEKHQRIPESSFIDDKAELSASEIRSPTTVAMRSPTSSLTLSEMGHEGEVVEADDGMRPPELDHMTFRAELEGSVPSPVELPARPRFSR